MISPTFAARKTALESELGEPVTVDGLTATWSIFQRKRGHRHSTDDLLTAWYALQEPPRPRHYLDLGTGIGTVGMLVLSGLEPDTRMTCIEAQEISFRLLRENLDANQLHERVNAIFGDLRNLHLATSFELITGSPPYFDVSQGILPADSQKAHARFELRGHVGDYARTAFRHLNPGGRFVFCFPTAQAERAVDAVLREGFFVRRRREVVPRVGLAPLFSLFSCTTVPHLLEHEPPFVVRNADGSHSDEMHAVRATFGWQPQRGPA